MGVQREMHMQTPTVFILYDAPLFARGLGRLLQQEERVEVVGIASKGEEALGPMRALKPDTILVEIEKEGDDLGMLLPWLLQNQSEVRMVSVSLSGNKATLYTGRRIAVREVTDLITAIVGPGEIKRQC